MNRKLRVNVVSESKYGGKGQGVHTAFMDTVDMLRRRDDVEVAVNSFGSCDVLHAHTMGPLYLSLMARYPRRRLLSAHVVPASMEGSLLGWRLWGPVASRFMVSMYNSADVVIAVAPAVRRTLEGLGVRSKQVVLTNPVNLEVFRPDPKLRAAGRRRLKLEPGDKVVLSVGQIQPRKGVEDFIRVAKAHPRLSFVWAGGRPFSVLTDDYAGMNQLMAKAPANLRFAGTFDLQAMPEVYNAADLFFFPSFQENCALAIAEAAACGLPLLLRDLPDYHELYGSRFLRASDAEGFAAEVKAFFSPTTSGAAARRKARATSLAMVRRFDVRLLGDRLVQTYRELAAG